MPTDASAIVRDEPIRVLVVDDEPSLRQTYRAVLVDQGCVVSLAASGRQALQFLMRESFDVLVVDLRMDEMDGIVFLQEALKIWPWIGVVIVSAYISEDVVPRARALGVTRLVEKPVSIRILTDNVIEEARTKRSRRVDLPTGNALALMREHLRILSELGQKAIGSETLAQVLSEFGKALASMLRFDVAGILVMGEQGESPTLHLVGVNRLVGDGFLKALQAEVLTRFRMLSSGHIDEAAIGIREDGVRHETSGPQSLGSSVSVPIISDNEVSGLVTLATVEPETYSPADVSLLYHAANHLSAVFMALRRMHRLATRDPLTGVYNRIRLEEELERMWQIGRRYGTSMGVVVVDIDNFKTLNDTYGHSVGDEILRSFAQVMQRAARGTDVIARYGGDEFVAILPRASENDACAFGLRLLNAIRSYAFCEDRLRLHLTVSIGLATSMNPTAPSTGSAVLSQADRALYMAKRAGRNRMCLWPGKAFDGTEAPEPVAGVVATAQTGGKTRDHILIVDDEPSILALSRTMLQREGFEVTTLPSATEAIQAIREQPDRFDVLVTDISMPEKDGIALMHEIGELDENIVKIVMTGNATVDNAVKCLREGAYDFIEKPIERTPFLAMIRRALEYHSLRIENARYQSHLEEMVSERSQQLATSLEEVKRSYEFTLEALVAMLDAREHQTSRHSLRTREMAVTLARQMNLTGDSLDVVATGALLHDIGKIGIPDAILLKPGPLLPDEWEVMRQHPEIGYNIVRSSPYLAGPAAIVREHQEHYDGRGYPRALKGERICIGARIFAVIDAYDAMRSARPYRKAVTPEMAGAEIRRSAGKQFDPAVVEAFTACQDEIERILSSPPPSIENASGTLPAGA